MLLDKKNNKIIMEKINIDSKTKLKMIIKYDKPLIDLSENEIKMIISLINEKYSNNYIIKFIEAGYLNKY